MRAVAEIQAEPISKQSLRLWLKLLKANSVIETELRRRLREHHESTLPRFDVMSALARYPCGLKMSKISALLRVSNGNVTAIVDRLVEDRLVERCADAGDRRAHIIKLTQSGLSKFSEQALDHEAWVAELLAGLGHANLQSFNTMLEDINTHLETRGAARHVE